MLSQAILTVALISVCWAQMILPSFGGRPLPPFGQGNGGNDGGNGGGSGGGGFKCRQPVDPGPCMASMRRFHYDYKQDRCKAFTYGGCQGNGNNFESKLQCERECKTRHDQGGSGGPDASLDPFACQQPKDEGPCRGSQIRYFYNGRRCKRFTYGGCQGNSNNFKSLSDCRAACMSGQSGMPQIQPPRPPGWYP